MPEDCNGYEPLAQHLAFLGVSASALAQCESQQCPLGMTPAEFVDFEKSLRAALSRAGLTDCDVRLKGSSAIFYSGWHKLMPYGQWDLHEAFASSASRNRPPDPWELTNIDNAVNNVWNDFLRPIRRPFDSMHRIGIDLYPSDFDVQVSSDQLAGRVIAQFGGVPDLISTKGGHFKREKVEIVCPELAIQWASIQGAKLRRSVSIAVFPSAGPPNLTPSIGHLSSHFRGTDWKLI